MLKSKLLVGCLALLVSAWVLTTGGLSPARTFAAAEPCPSYPDTSGGPSGDSPPSAPKNLRILIGWLTAPLQATLHAAARHQYFDALTARSDCYMALSLRSQEQLDALPTRRGSSERHMPVIYDAAMDAGRWAIDPSGESPNSGSTGTQQKRPILNVAGVSSMLLTWETRFDKGFLSETGKPGASRSERQLGQHKTWKIIAGSGDMWVTWKTNYGRAGNQGRGEVAEMLMTSGGKFLAGGSSNKLYGSEILGPRVSDFYIRPDTWTRYWFFVEGTIAAGETVHLSAWAADEGREPILLYDRLPYLAPATLNEFHLFYDSSQKQATNTLSQSWNRNMVVLTGLTYADMLGLLQKPVN